MGESPNDFEIAKKVLSLLEYGKAVSLKKLSSESEVSYQTLMFVMRPAIQSGLIARTRDDKEIFYTLRRLEYERELAQAYGQPVPEEERGRPSVITRTRNTTLIAPALADEGDASQSASPRRSGDTAEVRRRVTASVRESSTHLERVAKVAAKPEPETPVSRSSMELPFIDRKRSQQLTASAIPSRNIPLSGAFKRAPSTSSSGTHKSVFINNVSNRGSRSSFSAMPPQPLPNQLHRTDTNFPMKSVSELPQRATPILAFRTASNNVEYSDAMIREVIGVTEGVPLLAIDSDKTCFELWSTFSALANSGGGIIMLGVRKHGISYVIRKNPHIEDLLRSVQKDFNDRTVISDAPREKDSPFIQTRADGKKQFIVIFVDPEAIERLPVFTKLDSFGAQKDGCYCIKNNEVVRCNDEETKALWQKFYLVDEQPDWNQTGELLRVDMSRKLQLAQIDDEDSDEQTYLTNRLITKSEKKGARQGRQDEEFIEILDENGDTCETIRVETPLDDAPPHAKRVKQRANADDELAIEQPAPQPQPKRPPAFNAFASEATRQEMIEPARRIAEKRAEANLLGEKTVDVHDAISKAEKAPFRSSEVRAAHMQFDPATGRFIKLNDAPSSTILSNQSSEAIRAAILLAGDFTPNVQKASQTIHSRFPDAQSELLDIQPSVEAIRAARASKSAEAEAERAIQNEAIKAAILKEEAEKAAKLAQMRAAEAAVGPAEPEPEKPKARRGRKPKALLEAEAAAAQMAKPVTKAKAAEHAVTDGPMPPILEDADLDALNALAQPAVEFPRLPAVRICSIATKILRLARLTVQELSTIMHRTPVSIRKNVVTALSDDPHFKVDGKRYYYVD